MVLSVIFLSSVIFVLSAVVCLMTLATVHFGSIMVEHYYGTNGGGDNGQFLLQAQKTVPLVSSRAGIKRADSQCQWSLTSLLAQILACFDTDVSVLHDQARYIPKKHCSTTSS